MRRTEFLSSISTWAPNFKLGGFFVGATTLVGATALVVACSSSDSSSPTTGGDDTTADGSTAATSCGVNPGALPSPTCDTSTNCGAEETSCSMSGAGCGGTSACAALVSNSGTTDNFRMRGLYLIEPEALTTNAVQGAIVNTGLELTAPTCGESGTSLFNWLMTFDLNAMTLKTGGAPVPTDKSGQAGFCYMNAMDNNYQVSSVTTALHKDSDGTYSTDVIPKLNIPFGTSGGDVILPLTNLKLQGIALSENNNCIGSESKAGIDNSCADVPNCNRWKTAGALGSYVTLEDADKVNVVQLQESLCALLSGYQAGTKTAAGLCTRDSSNKIVAKGDYCSTTNSAGGCQDSFWLSATFAASAVKVTDGSDNAQCGTSSTTSTDAGTTADAGDAGH